MTPDNLPGALETLEDCRRWAAWIAVNVTTGVLDVGRARECNRAVQTVKAVEEKLNLARRFKHLEQQLKVLRKETTDA